MTSTAVGQEPRAESATPSTSPVAPTAPSALPPDEAIARLRERVAELERERDHLVAVVDILTAISSTLQFTEILQAIARKLGETFGLDRCSIYLAGESQHVRLMATYKDPSVQNLIVDLDRYPELKRAFESGETVFIPDASADPLYQGVQMRLALRNVRSVVVVPIRWRGTVIGAIFLRTERESAPFSDRDVRFCQVVASLTANALRNAHRFEALVRGEQAAQREARRSELQRIAFVAFIRRLLDRFTNAEDHMWAETLLAPHADEELERLVSVAMEVISEEAKTDGSASAS